MSISYELWLFFNIVFHYRVCSHEIFVPGGRIFCKSFIWEKSHTQLQNQRYVYLNIFQVIKANHYEYSTLIQVIIEFILLRLLFLELSMLHIKSLSYE